MNASAGHGSTSDRRRTPETSVKVHPDTLVG